MRTRNATAFVAVAVSGLLAAAGCFAPQTYAASTRRARFEATCAGTTPAACARRRSVPARVRARGQAARSRGVVAHDRSEIRRFTPLVRALRSAVP